MKISHHISDESLLEYASGAMGEGWSIAIATHLAMCPSCRSRLAGMEAIGASLLDGMPTAAEEVDEDASWESVLSRIENSPEHAVITAPEKSVEKPDVPEPLRSYLGGNTDSVKWRSLGLGAYHFPIKTGDEETDVRLLRIPAGKPVPEHGHGGRELTLVLSGSFVDGTDRFGPGDFEETDASVEHQPVAEPGVDCICLAITDAPLKFKSRIVRMIQPLLGI